ncbi:MAG: hypothetical protein EOO14_08520 [Chitinophagaceae bacterium]|nr:MAG: hypothetical protein EOO14_08520 [Chitinophagaceae bacterium]
MYATYMKTPLILTAILSLLFSCGQTEEISKEEPAARQAKADAETFEVFNEQFHADSTFQVSRIAFPLEGQQIDAFEERDWTPQNWQMMKMPVGAPLDTFEYKRNLEKTDSSVTEEIWVEESGFRVERTFKLKDNKWFLTFYNDINI